MKTDRIDIAIAVSNFEFPEKGMSAMDFCDAVGIDAVTAGRTLEWLHRKKLICLSNQGGYKHVCHPAERPQRGRPKKLPVESAMPPDIEKFLLGAALIMGRIAALDNKRPKEAWPAGMKERVEIAHAITAEAGQLMAFVRKFIARHPESKVEQLRDVLWVTYPKLMPLVVETQPGLGHGSSEPLPPPPQRRGRLKNNMGIEDRILAYFKQAGVRGLAAYQIKTKFGWKVPAEEIARVLRVLEDDFGLIYSVEGRTNGKGPKTTRYFDSALGRPGAIGSDSIPEFDPNMIPPWKHAS